MRWKQASQLFQPLWETLQLLQPQQQERPLKALKQNQQVPASVTPVQKQKKCTWKSPCKKALAKTVKEDRESKEDEEATASQRWITEPSSRPSQELEEETEETITAWSLSLSELREIQEDFSHCPGECIITWLLQCWDNRANSVELESKEARESGSLAKKPGIDKAMGKKTQALCLWRWLLWSVRARCPYKEGIPCNLSKWAAMEKCVVYLRELAIWGITNIDLDNVQLSPGADDSWWKFEQSAPTTHANPLATINWKDDAQRRWSDFPHPGIQRQYSFPHYCSCGEAIR